MKQVFSKIKAVLTHPVVLLAVGMLAAVWLLARAVQPVIARVPVVAPDGRLTVEGKSFGRGQGGSSLLVAGDDGLLVPVAPAAWSNQEITAPAPATGGTVQVVRKLFVFTLVSNKVAFVVQAPNLPSQPYGYQVPVEPGSPWPTFRRDHRNTGRSELPASYAGDQPWSFRTGKGIFSTPVIDADGTIYVGSADHVFYAIRPDGTQKWAVETGEIIDSAGALPRPAEESGERRVIFPSGDGYLYTVDAEDGSVLAKFDARVAARESYNNWFEGNVAIGFDSTVYAGNTNFNYYAIHPDGSLRWVYETGANNWSNAALGDDATIFWGSNDTFIRGVDPAGMERWRTMTLGFIAASAAVGSDGTVYMPSFDSYLYALDPATGDVRWKFKTNDHIYSSVALGADAAGSTTAIYFGSTDGIFYAVDPEGKLLWRYDAGDPIRSSPALGKTPDGRGDIVYFGAGNGKLYALNAADGTRRWSFDTTPADPELADRNDLNGSPALGLTGVVIGGEHGDVWYLPYDYCLHSEDTRCSVDPTEDLPNAVAGFFYVTPGGSTVLTDTAEIPIASIVTLRLLLREGGETIDAWVCNSPVGCPDDALVVQAEPAFPLRVEKSADGHFLHVIPEGFLPPATTVTLTIAADIYTGGVPLGNLTLGGKKRERIEDTVMLRTRPTSGEPLPLRVSENDVAALEWTRLAVPIPPMMPSLNQIGFDYLDWIIGMVDITEANTAGGGQAILWAIGGKRDSQGRLVADPDSDFTLPLSGRYQDNAYIWTNRDFVMPVTGIPIPFNLFELRGQLADDLRAEPGTTVYADTEALGIPTFGPYLVIAGLANNWFEKLLVAGTYLTRPYEDGPANRRPSGVTVSSVDYLPPTGKEAGRVTATFQLADGVSYRLDEHRAGILLVDPAQTKAVFMDYHNNLSTTADAAGNLATVTLTLPSGTVLPEQMDAVVMADVFPLYRQAVTP